eukprot:4108520-Prymnesium_polylepis.1
MPQIYEPLAKVLTSNTEWKPTMLDAVSGAMARWKGAGQQVNLTPQRLKTYKSRIPAVAKKGPPRWKTPRA